MTADQTTFTYGPGAVRDARRPLAWLSTTLWLFQARRRAAKLLNTLTCEEYRDFGKSCSRTDTHRHHRPRREKP
ncbi:hypothetical protein ACWGQT_00085 [Streptomyces yangpuensis]